jgi:dihydroorotate dehydrogenase
MPDWFYRTVSRPILFRLSAERGRNLALGVMGRLARLPLGPRVIDLLGHMRPHRRLETALLGKTLISPIGLGPAVDGEAIALPALARFGVGFVDVGPVSIAGHLGHVGSSIERRDEQGALWLPEPERILSLAEARPRLAELAQLGVPTIVRAALPDDPRQAAAEAAILIRELTPWAIAVDRPDWSADDWSSFLPQVGGAAVLAIIRKNSPPDGVAGVLVDGAVSLPGGCLIGEQTRDATRDLVQKCRERLGPDAVIVARGGVHEPADALELIHSGANAVEIDTGLVFTGPGLVKRANEAVLWDRARHDPPPTPERSAAMSWFWAGLMGAGMLIGGIISLVIAMTRVVLPYDEAFIGLSRDEIAALNPRLMAFLAHDRVSVTGSMFALAALYVGLAYGGIRRGHHWARIAFFVSAFAGFATFFAFLGYGYLDPFHAFVALALLQLLLLALHAPMTSAPPRNEPDLHNDAAWRRSLWGQFLCIIHACGLLGAGIVISTIGVTHVLVHEDLEFLQTSLAAIREAHPRLLPLIAHDRSTFGGMLLANGLAFLLAGLWGFRRGEAWLWWSMAIAGASGYAAALGVHFAVGYTDVAHLLPAFLGMGCLALGLGLSREYLLEGSRR